MNFKYLMAASVLAMGLVTASGAMAGGGPIVTASPSTINPGQTTTLTWSTYGNYCDTQQVEFKDKTGGGNTSLCSATIASDGSNSTASCPTNALTVPGTKTIGFDYLTSCTQSAAATTTVTVNSNPIPTTQEWTLWGMAALMLVGGGVFASRRFRTAV